jgi:hypothetical protein
MCEAQIASSRREVQVKLLKSTVIGSGTIFNERNSRAEALFSRAAHVVARMGLAMSGATSGTFVAAYLAKADIETFNSIGFIASMILVGIIAFYLGIDIPRLHASQVSLGARHPIPQWNTVELLGATGTFLAAVAALTSVYAIVLDEDPQPMWEFAVGCCWLLGAMMQIGAGAIGRLRLNAHVAVVVPLSRERP